MLTLIDWDVSWGTFPGGVVDAKEITLPPNLYSITFAYDRGRIFVSINGRQIYENLSGASDFMLTINNVGRPGFDGGEGI